jgi:uncharacterized protein YlxW (UPF0749 family)
MGLFELIIAIAVLSTVGSIAKAVLTRRARGLPPADREALRRIEEGMLEIREHVAAMRQDVDELQERVDFTERVLTKNREGELRLGTQAMRDDEGR